MKNSKRGNGILKNKISFEYRMGRSYHEVGDIAKTTEGSGSKWPSSQTGVRMRLRLLPAHRCGFVPYLVVSESKTGLRTEQHPSGKGLRASAPRARHSEERRSGRCADVAQSAFGEDGGDVPFAPLRKHGSV